MNYTTFTPDEEIEEIHQRGVDEANHGHLDAAAQSYDEALILVKHGYDTDPFGQMMHLGRLQRDKGFLPALHAAKSKEPVELGEPVLLEESLYTFVTLEHMSRESGVLDALGASKVSAETGATRGFLARYATMDVVFLSYLEPPKVRPAQNLAATNYFEAYRDARAGNNRYYETMIAANAARFEALRSGGTSRIYWLNVAASSALNARTSDPENFVPSLKAIASKAPGARSRGAAHRSIRRKP